MNEPMQIDDWEIDKSAGRPILVYKGCSIIEGSDADFVLSAIIAALSAEVQHVATAAEFADRMFTLHGFMLCERHNGKHAVTVTFPNLAEAQQFHGALVDLSRHTTAAARAKQEGRQQDLGQLEIRLKDLISEHPEKAQLALIDDYSRTWFVADLISEASGRIPLLEIEALVSRHLAAMEGGEA